MEKNKVNIISVSPEAVVDLKISGGFYQRLNRLVYTIGSIKGEEEMLKAILKIKNNSVVDPNNKTITDSFAYDLETLLILVRDLEQAFKDAGQTKNNEIEYEVPAELREALKKNQM